MTNYERASELVKKGVGHKHYTFKDTGCVFIDLGGKWGGYILPEDKYVDITYGNVHVGYGNIDLREMMVFDASHRSDYDRHIM